MQFQLIQRANKVPKAGVATAYLSVDHWNDYSFVTMFCLSLHDDDGGFHEIGHVKIGFRSQGTDKPSYEQLGSSPFEYLPEGYFSLGTDADYYCNLELLPKNIRELVLKSLNDMVFNTSIIELAQDEDVFRISLLRGVSLTMIKGQFSRALIGQPLLTDFEFSFVRPEHDRMSGIDLEFKVKEDSKPSTNIHAIIGRNGVGKTTLLNGMIEAVTSRSNSEAKFYDIANRVAVYEPEPISLDYFSSLVSVSFSAFDSFNPPQEQSDPSKGTCYYYIGLKDKKCEEKHRTIPELQADCVKALTDCFRTSEKTSRWIAAINKLSSDENFDYMRLGGLEERYRELRKTIPKEEQSDTKGFRDIYFAAIEPYLKKMSSGHAIVLLTMTRLVATVEEKTLVLLDEPESHLHPPLLSAFVSALADLLHNRNGVAIIATHSPVVLQEIPRSCVWKIHRTGSNVSSSRPSIETFSENVGVLTSEVFGLEVERSGFHDLLAKSVEAGGTYENIVTDYGNQLGFEGRAILKVLIAIRDRSNQHDATE